MSSSGRRLAWSLWAICVALVAGSVVLFALTHSTDVEGKNPPVDLVLAVVLLAFPTVGALVASRRPGNAIGWLFLGIGVAFSVGGFAAEYAIKALFAAPGSLPGGEVAAWISDWLYLPAIFCCTLVLLLFPHGRLLSRRWRPIAWLAAVAALLILLGSALLPGPLPEFTSVENPAGMAGLKTLLDLIGGLGWVLGFCTIIVSAFSVVVRFRRARGEEREQLKWIAGAAAVLAVFWLTAFFIPGTADLTDALFLIGLAVFPVSVGFAISKYRLYDIDRIINRTLVYGVLTAGLAGLYFGIVVALQQALGSVTQGSDLAIAGSTLAVAALFRPGRRRVQALVDRRFYRRRYDAAKTLDAFSARLRREIKLSALTAELSAVVERTMQPAHVSLWLREVQR